MVSSEKFFRFRPGAVLRFTGEDHAAFLQGQGTADLRGPVGTCRYCLWLDHRGLIHGDGFVLKESEAAMLLVSYACLAEDLRARFDHHIIADDVEIEDLTLDYGMISIVPGEAGQLLPTGAESLVPAADALTRLEAGYCFHGRRLGRGTIDVLWPVSSPDPFAGTDAMKLESAEALRVRADIPLIPQDCPDQAFNPVEAHVLSAVSFTKGCYLGQEVVSRVQRLQRASRRLVSVCGSGQPAQVPIELTMENQIVGAVTSVVKFSDTWSGIGWLKSRIADGNSDFDGCPLQVRSLPES